jgi:uncharacterized membrane protein
MGRIEDAKTNFLSLVALVLLGLFAGIWIFVGIKLLTFDPSDTSPTVTFSTAIATTAGFLAATVATVTATVLGIEVQKVRQDPADGSTPSVAKTTQDVLSDKTMLWVGALTYLLVGLFVLIVWLARSEQAADMIETFALGILGWIAGGFASLFRTAA